MVHTVTQAFPVRAGSDGAAEATRVPTASRPALILASGSPRRRGLLEQIGLPFSVVVPEVDEEVLSRGATCPSEVVIARALGKGQAAHDLAPDAVCLSADTVVISPDGQLLGKPGDADRNREMLVGLSGNWHTVLTAVALCGCDRRQVVVEGCRVAFRTLLPAEVSSYARGGEGWDKAGGYAIQGAAAMFVRRVEGDYASVVGLPLCRLALLLRQWGLLD